MDCGVFGGWPYLAYEYIKNEVSALLSNAIQSSTKDKAKTLP